MDLPPLPPFATGESRSAPCFASPIFRSAFTLIEVLVSISIVAILAALVLAGSRAALTQASRAAATANLRQISVAILTYVSENDGSLPGPLNIGQVPRYSKNVTDTLGYKLWSYVGLPTPTVADQPFSLLSSPNFLKYRKDPTSASYAMNQQIVVSGTTCKPWGVQGSSQPIKSVTLASILADQTNGLSGTWAMTEVDRKNVSEVTGADPGWKNKLPVAPIHGDVRITIFFDWHAEPVPVAQE
jgi:prepilin-type N-terminal cleavage/methylation domain-containing protein